MSAQFWKLFYFAYGKYFFLHSQMISQTFLTDLDIDINFRSGNFY